MIKNIFNPNAISVSNGNYFALPSELETSKLVLISVPWDVTASYKTGSSMSPDAIIDASEQIDLYDIDFGNAYEQGIGTIPFNDEILELSKEIRCSAEKVISHLSDGGSEEDSLIAKSIKKVNEASAFTNDYVYNTVSKYIEAGKFVALVGGDHSTPYGLIKALANKYDSFGILHFDAHADLRVAFEGFKHSHASIMYNVINDVPQISNLIQVGIRDFCEEELDIINSNSKITSFFDSELSNRQFCGETWDTITNEIISKLPNNVYISFDIDALQTIYCPNTGTPVPGGLSYSQATYLITKLAKSNKKIIGFDVNEVGYIESSDWDANVGARLIYKIASALLHNNCDR